MSQRQYMSEGSTRGQHLRAVGMTSSLEVAEGPEAEGSGTAIRKSARLGKAGRESEPVRAVSEE